MGVGTQPPLGTQPCAGCERPITDRFLLNVLDRAWHTACVTCTDCGQHLADKCFSRDGKLFCRTDFFRRFGTKCGGCSQGISPNDLVRRARNKVYHLKCFTCMVCRKQLSTGEELYVLDENKFICKEDYLASKMSGSDAEDGDMDLDAQVMLDKMDDTLSDTDAKDLGGCCSDEDEDEDSHEDSLSGALSGSMQGHPPGHQSATGPPLHHSPMAIGGVGGPGTIHHTPPGINASINSTLDRSGDSSSSPRPNSPHSLGDIKDEENNNKNTTNNNSGANSTSGGSVKGGTSVDGGDGDEIVDDGKDCKDGEGGGGGVGSKRRGPRTTIKAKQLETLKAAFAATPKPTRHIREQLAQETGLNMRVIQVWFQNRRSKERRMKQLSALGARRHFFRTNPRRMRALQPGELDDGQLQPGFNYFGDNGDFYPGAYPPYGDFYPGQEPGMPFGLPPGGPQGTPPLVDASGHPAGMGPDGVFGMPSHPDMINAAGPTGHNQSPEPGMGGMPPHPSHGGDFGQPPTSGVGLPNGLGIQGPPRGMTPNGFPQLHNGPPHPPEMTGESW